MTVLTKSVFETFAIAAMTSGIAYTWVNYLTQPGEIFGFVRKQWNLWKYAAGQRALIDPDPEDELTPMERKAERDAIFNFVSKPLFDCHRCVAGQLTLWVGFFAIRPYGVVEHIAAICWAIIFTEIISKVAR